MLNTLLRSFIEEPKNMCFEGEDSNENILYVFRKSLITNLGWSLFAILLLLLPFFFNFYFFGVKQNFPNIINGRIIFIINGFWYLFTFGFILERFLNWFFNVHIITDKRVVDMDFDDLLHRNVSEAPLRNIEDITHTISGTMQTLFNFGNVSIQTAGERRELEFLSVDHPAKIQDILSDLVSSVRGDNN